MKIVFVWRHRSNPLGVIAINMIGNRLHRESPGRPNRARAAVREAFARAFFAGEPGNAPRP
jgi:hypothetical protein